jgi:septal ring factor EnvC (AmiA/AmiB activator)
MSRRSHLAVAIIMCVVLGVAHAHPQGDIQRKQDELETIRTQIRELEAKVKVQQQNETETLELLDTYDSQALLLRKLITRLKTAERQLQSRIDTTRRSTRSFEAQLAFLKAHYAKHVRSVYKTGRLHDTELLFASSSVEEFIARNEYLHRFSEQRRSDAQRIQRKQLQLSEIQARAERELSEERRLLAEKSAEEDRLAVLTAERREALIKIRKDKNMMARQMQRQIKAAKDMEDMIARLIEEERVRAEHERETAAAKKLPPTPEAPVIPGEFENKKGHLRWPVSEGSIVARFGPYRHPTLHTVTTNTGIDIAVQAGSPVVAVASGKVSKIWFIPSYGNLVILNHHNGYRTIYTHLAEIEVAEGEVIKEGDLIGTSGDSMEGPRLHFEVWKDRDKQNPEQWLMRQ